MCLFDGIDLCLGRAGLTSFLLVSEHDARVAIYEMGFSRRADRAGRN